ncbi:unnamed protein product [Rangifer tarandus platyrhynchus]|uniref:Uncharacterized protein n=1 Tax=Rangifer tarandus platyrhynchus TaxID=3082113 RepID=A0AC59ZPR3_RANTA
MMRMLVCSVLSQRSLRLSSFSFHSFFRILFCGSDLHHSVLWVIYQFFRLSYSVDPPSMLFLSGCLFLSSSRSLVNISCIFSTVFPRSWIIFTIIILNSFSGTLPVSTSFSSFPGILSCAFIWDITSFSS